jgi:dihydroxyacetone kinase-like predicted kinase
VIPTRSVVQTLAAVAVHDDGARFDDAVVAMADAARASRYGAITIASREALTTAGQCRVGDVLGLVEGDIVEIGIDPIEVAEAILRRLLSSGGELVTFVLGTEAPHGVADRLCGMVIAENPGVDVEVIDGGQPLWPLIIGVE